MRWANLDTFLNELINKMKSNNSIPGRQSVSSIKSKASNTLVITIIVTNADLALLHARHCLQHITSTISLQQYDNPMK